MARPKIALIGGGNIGGVLAEQIALRELGDVVLFDVVEGPAAGQGARHRRGLAARWTATRSCAARTTTKDIRGADLVIITAGLARKPGMSRDDLLKHQPRRS